MRKEDGVKHVFIASGVRYDLAERSPEYVEELARHHVGGQLSVAPEHVSPRVLEKMKKPGIESYERFQAMFACASKDAGKEQYDIPYFISGHPGSTLEDMVDLALWLKKNGRRPRQVQDFIPTPMAMATCMYRTGIDPLTMQPVYTATGLRAKRLQKSAAALPERTSGRWRARRCCESRPALDLIGNGPDAPRPPADARRKAPGRRPRRRLPRASSKRRRTHADGFEERLDIYLELLGSNPVGSHQIRFSLLFDGCGVRVRVRAIGLKHEARFSPLVSHTQDVERLRLRRTPRSLSLERGRADLPPPGACRRPAHLRPLRPKRSLRPMTRSDRGAGAAGLPARCRRAAM